MLEAGSSFPNIGAAHITKLDPLLSTGIVLVGEGYLDLVLAVSAFTRWVRVSWERTGNKFLEDNQLFLL